MNRGSLDESLAIRTAMRSGNINVSSEYLPIEEHTAREKKQGLEELERRRRARLLALTTDDEEVRKDLRAIGEPQCMFGEGPGDRRERLRDLLSRMGPDAIIKREKELPRIHKARDAEVTWYHEGPDSLKISRQWILDFSMLRARQRLENAKKERRDPDKVKIAKRQVLQKRLQAYCNQSSQIGDNRVLSFCQFSPDSKLLVTASWSGLLKLWNAGDLSPIRTMKGHVTNISCAVFHPYSTISLESSACNIASSGVDGSVKLWSLECDEPLADFPGHTQRVARLAYHPSGRFLATCCYDASWRLWDLVQKEEVLHQEGHSKGVHCIGFHKDGSLTCTGGLDGYGRLWDLRTGRCVMFLEGHLRSILGLDFSPNGFHLVTASEDHTCKCWDLRNRDCLYTIPAHSNLVSHIKYQPTEGHYFVTSSYDQTVKIWLSSTWQQLRTLNGHDNRITCVDVSSQDTLVTCGFDRTFKLWSADD